MIVVRCEECGLDKPLTYRAPALGLERVCASCIRANHPETAGDDGVTIPDDAPGRGVRRAD